MPIIDTGAYAKAQWPGVKEWWGNDYAEHKVEYTDLYDTVMSDKGYEEYVQDTGFGLAPIQPQGQGVQYQGAVQGFVARGTNVAIGSGFIVTHEEIQDNQYPKLAPVRTRQLAFAFRQTKEHMGGNGYNRAANASYVGADGVPLASTAHPNTSGGTWSNTFTTGADLSELALEDAVIQIMGFQNDKGLQINLMPRSLIVPRQLFPEATRILKSQYQTGTGNNDINAIVAMNAFPEGIKLNHYLTAANTWFIRTNLPNNGMIYQEREGINFDQDNDFSTKNIMYKGYERYTFLWVDPRAVFVSVGP